MLVEWTIDLFDFLLFVNVSSDGVLVLILNFYAVNTGLFQSLKHLLPDSIEPILDDLEESWQFWDLNIIGAMVEMFEAKRSIIVGFTVSESWICVERIVLDRKRSLLVLLDDTFIFDHQSMLVNFSFIFFNRSSGSCYLLYLQECLRFVHIHELCFVLYKCIGDVRFVYSSVDPFFLGGLVTVL